MRKKDTRRIAGQKKTSESRTARAVLFTQNDYIHCLSRSRERMNGLLSTYDRIFKRKERGKPDATIRDCGFVNK